MLLSRKETTSNSSGTSNNSVKEQAFMIVASVFPFPIIVSILSFFFGFLALTIGFVVLSSGSFSKFIKIVVLLIKKKNLESDLQGREQQEDDSITPQNQCMPTEQTFVTCLQHKPRKTLSQMMNH